MQTVGLPVLRSIAGYERSATASHCACRSPPVTLIPSFFVRLTLIPAGAPTTQEAENQMIKHRLCLPLLVMVLLLLPCVASSETKFCTYQGTNSNNNQVTTICVQCADKMDACPLVATFKVQDTPKMYTGCLRTSNPCTDCPARAPKYKKSPNKHPACAAILDDLIDNDGDGRVDEEQCDGVDNDQDTRVDEDTYEDELEPVTGTYSDLHFVVNSTQECPPPTGAPTAVGRGFITYKTLDNPGTGAGTGQYRITLTGALTSSQTAQHIHAGTASACATDPSVRNRPVLITLNAPVGGTMSGTFGPLTAAQELSLLAPEGAYINIHTSNNPGGEIRGNLQFTADTPGGVPTLTEWGMIVLATLLVVTGTMFVLRGRRVRA